MDDSPPPPQSYFKSSASPGLSISYFCCLSRELLIPRSDTVQLHHLALQLVIVLWLLKSWTCSQWRAVCTKLTEVAERSRGFLGQLQSKVMASLCRMRQTVPYAVSLFIYKLSNSTLLRYFILAAVIQGFLKFWAKAYRLIFNKKQEHLKQVLLNNLEKHGCASFLAHMDALTNGFSMAKFGSDMMTHVLLTHVRHFKRDSQRIVKAVYCMHLHTAAFGSSQCWQLLLMNMWCHSVSRTLLACSGALSSTMTVLLLSRDPPSATHPLAKCRRENMAWW